MGLFVPFQPPPDEYANHLALPQPQRLRLPSAHWLLLFLVLLCLIPRAVMALRIPSVCPDGVLYIHLAQAIDAGDWRSGFRDTTFNVYPLILTGLHRLGFDWELAAELWGVTVSSLVVLPLWGWVRRHFDDRVALLACLLYAVNPKFIEWSPEVMRDPTFWLLFMTAIYWLWRAVTEVRYRWFLAAGAAIMLASLTRMEGLFLLIPLTLWTFWRFVALRTDRKRLLLGAVLCVVIFPALAAAVKVGWACGHSDWSVLRLSPLARVETWLQSLLGHAPANVDAEGLEKPLGSGRMIWIFIPTMTRGLSPVFALLMFGGIGGWRRVWGRRDHQPLFYTAVVIMCGIWIQLWYDRNICPRYALPIVLMASPWAALGLLGLISRLLRIAGWMRCGVRPQQAIVAAVAATVALISLGDAMTSNGKYFETRQMAADLGCWVRNKYPQSPAIVGPVGITPIISFYARNAPYRPFRWEADDDSILSMIEQSQAGVVLLQPAKELTEARCAALAARLKEAGLEPVDRSALPATCDGLSVLLRGPQDPHIVREPSRVY
jgi:4-amino-4-deoxy-L-arabinose transferase-like glycosyltransferase